MDNYFSQLGYIIFFSSARNKNSYTSIFLGPISKSLGGSQYYFHWLSLKYSLKSISEDAKIFYWTGLFDLIRNNVVDIIKPEEVDDLVKQGNMEHKNDLIQVKTDGLTYLIHTCNYQCLVHDKDGKVMRQIIGSQKRT